MLSTLPNLKYHLRIDQSDTSQDSLLNLVLAGADQSIKNYVRHDLEQASYTEYYSGRNKNRLLLKQWPVTVVTNVWMDPNGYGGFGPGTNGTPFDSTTLQVSGTDYILEVDEANLSRSGILLRLSETGLQGMIGGMTYPSGIRQYTLSGWDRGGVWQYGDKNIKVQYTAGYAPGSIPGDLIVAENMLAAEMYFRLRGELMSNENLGEYSYGLLTEPKPPNMGYVRQLLGAYRDLMV